MKTKTKKIKQYSILALAATAVIPMACGNKEEADDPNITTRTINDITQLSSGTAISHDIDIDGNGTNDIKTYIVEQYGVLQSGLYNYGSSNTKVLTETMTAPGSEIFLKAIPSDELISAASATWENYGYTQFKEGSTNLGNFAGQGDKFVGVKFRIGSNTHYGWMKLNLSTDAKTLTVKDVGYDTRPDTGIKAGVK